jgi:integrase
MARRGMTILTAKAVKGATVPGKLFDGYGNGLFLKVGNVPEDASDDRKRNPPKSWAVRVEVQGRRREFGIGSAYMVTLAEARDRAAEIRKAAMKGKDPGAAKQAEREQRKAKVHAKRNAITFAEATHRVHKNLLPAWKNPKHGTIWIRSFEIHVFKQIGDMDIASIVRADVLKVLEPIWTEKYDTARRLRQRITSVFDWAIVAGHYKGQNPVALVTKALPDMRGRAKATHRKALPWEELPAFMSDLQEHDLVSGLCMQFLIHTCVRNGDARGTRWSEIDVDKAVWTIPAERTKMDVEHRVPLSPEATAILDKVYGLDSDIVFPTPNPRPGKVPVLSENALTSFMKKTMGRTDCVPHGFRSTFKDWATDSARAQWEVSEMALAHKVGNAVERAYARSDLYERRKELMLLWSRYAAGKSAELIYLDTSNSN